jgi:outer membrane lipoprotein-sorting protein
MVFSAIVGIFFVILGDVPKKLIMRILYFAYLILIGLSRNLLPLEAQTMSATEIIRMADEKFNGEKSGISTMIMTIIRPSWERTVEFKSWTQGRANALTLITAPARDEGQTFLKRGEEMWNWNPAINRLIKLPPSMMSQGWMGSDYTNDDILKESSIVNDYSHEIVAEEILDDRLCYKIKMIARQNASVIWGHQFRWIDKKDLIVLKTELYDEDGSLVRTELGSEIKVMDGRVIPTMLELIPAEDKGNKTIVIVKDIKFNVPIGESFFSQQNMKRVR